MSPLGRASFLVPLPLELSASLPPKVAHYSLCIFCVPLAYSRHAKTSANWKSLLNDCLLASGLSLRFNSPVALIFTLITNFYFRWIVSATGQFSRNMKGPRNPSQYPRNQSQFPKKFRRMSEALIQGPRNMIQEVSCKLYNVQVKYVQTLTCTCTYTFALTFRWY